MIGSPLWELRMTLDEALAVYLYFQVADTLEQRDERVVDAAWKIIDQRARKAIEAHETQNLIVARPKIGCTKVTPQ
jgi:hypothetical protein